MKTVIVSCLVIIFSIVYLSRWCTGLPQEAADEENYTSYALLYPEIAKKIGEEPIEIIDVVKSVRVYDSDDDTTSNTEEVTQPPPPDRLEVESVNATTVAPLNVTTLAVNATNITDPTPDPNLW